MKICISLMMNDSTQLMASGKVRRSLKVGTNKTTNERRNSGVRLCGKSIKIIIRSIHYHPLLQTSEIERT